jgi:acetylornithine deacetylase/succinyl-diaminopimelate desuccinylase-like protein
LPTASPDDRAQALAIFKELIEINTTDTPLGNVTTATTAMRKRFIDAGFSTDDVHLLGPDPRKQNLVVRFRASGTPTEKPVLFLCHMDVVEALRSDWSTDPFQFVEKDGYYYGRGTQDMKNSDAALVATFLRLHKEGYKPKRDLILALTADEEGGKFNGADWLVQKHRDLVDAAYVINPDAGGIELDHGRAVVADVEATEKVYSDFQITATNRGGHSSLPRPDNAIYELTAALTRLSLRDERGHSHLLHQPGRAGNRANGCGYQGGSGYPSGSHCRCAPGRRAKLQFELPHHLRSHAPQRRTRE